MFRPATLSGRLPLALGVMLLAAQAQAQPPVHHQYRADMPTGAIGRQQLARGGPVVGYYQPVELVAPLGALLSVAEGGDFSVPRQTRLLAGLLVGGVYQFKVANIRGMEGEELFPTVEVIDRLYPPPGQATRFPIPIALTEEELRLASDGRFVQRIVYIEPPQGAIPQALPPGTQPYFDVPAGEDALHVADRLGRPVAILRIGSRVPLQREGSTSGVPSGLPVLWLDDPQAAARGLESILPAPPRIPAAGAAASWTAQPGSGPALAHGTHPEGRWRPPVLGGIWPSDEYICDGGAAHGVPAVHPSQQPTGLRPEDTVAYFSTADGRPQVAVSNRVCIYAPRFAAVRQIWAPVVHELHQRMAGVEQPVRLVQQEQRRGARTALQPQPLAAQVGLDQAQRLRERTGGRLVDQVAQLVLASDALMPHENLALIERGELDGREGTKLARAVAAARMWASDVAVQVVIDGRFAVEARSSSMPQEMLTYETFGKPRLRLCKIADRSEAASGQTVTFTLRLDNVGEQTIQEVCIVDHLSPRLELIPGSAHCSLPAQFEVEPTSDGQAQVLRWRLTEPLKVGEGGVIRFQTRVR